MKILIAFRMAVFIGELFEHEYPEWVNQRINEQRKRYEDLQHI